MKKIKHTESHSKQNDKWSKLIVSKTEFSASAVKSKDSGEAQQTSSSTDVADNDTTVASGDIIIEWNKRMLLKEEFCKTTANVLYEDFNKLIKGKKLDSNLKRCVGFVRRMKQFSDSQKSSIISDLDVLNLTKYISEIASIIIDLRLKPSDTSGVLSVFSELHKRYIEFSDNLMTNFEKLLSVKELNSVVLSKISSDLRLFAELLLGGVLTQNKAVDLFIRCIQQLKDLDKDGGQLVLPFVILLRDISDDLMGVIPKDIRLSLKDHVSELKRSVVLTAQTKNKIKTIFKQYFGKVKCNLVKKNGEILGYEKYNRKLLVTRGEVPTDRKEAHEELVTRFLKYHSNATKLGYLLDLSVPKIRKLPPDPEDEFEKALLMTEDGEILSETPGIVLFEDEETRQFYQDFPDLKKYLVQLKKTPCRKSTTQSQGYESDGSELTSSDEENSDSEDSSEDNFDLDEEKSDLLEENESEDCPSDLDGDAPPSMRLGNDEEELPQDSYSKYIREKFLNYLESLKNNVNKNMIDKAAFEFVETFKSKRCKKDLVRHLFIVPRQRVDLVRLYSRLVASLSKVYPEIGTELCSMLRKDFRYHVLKRDQTRVECKLKVTRFIGELTNFSVFPKSEAFSCLKLLLRNFVHHQVEMACCFIETCGRFLYRNFESHRRMKLYLAELLRRKSVQCLEPRYVYMVDCAYYQICAPSGTSAPRKIKAPLHAFLEHILCYDLQKNTLERANKVLRMYDWRAPSNFDLVVQILSSPWKLSYVQLDTAAALLASLKQFRPSVTQAVIENLSEGVRMGCEYDLEDINNIRMSTCQYFANLYKYKNVSTTAILNVMYYLISYGVTYHSSEFSRMDPPDSLYRIRLICEMLRIAGEYLINSKSKRRLDFFLKYFQRYFLYKRTLEIWMVTRFPRFVEEVFEDMVKRLRPNWKFAENMEQAETDIVELDQKLRGKVKSDKLKRAIENETKCVRIPVEVESRDKLKQTYAKIINRRLKRRKENPPQILQQVLSSCEEVRKSKESKEDFRNGENALETLEEDDFEEAFESMCSESLAQTGEVASSMWQKLLDIPVAKVTGTESGMNALSFGLSTVKVTVLTKQNNKPRGKTLEVTNQEDFLVNIKRRDEAEKLEKQEVKNRILELTRLQQEEEQKEREQELQDLLGKLLRAPRRNLNV